MSETTSLPNPAVAAKPAALLPALVPPAPLPPGLQTVNLAVPASFDHIQRVGKMFAASQMVPMEYQNNLPNCVIAIEMASRIGASIFAVMNNLDIIHGRPSWRSQFIIAAVNTSGRFSPLRFRLRDLGEKTIEYTYWTGSRQEGNRRKENGKITINDKECVAFAFELLPDGTREITESAPVTFEMAVKEGWYTKNDSKWQTMGELMIRYRAAAFFGRMYTPEVLNGMHTSDELSDIEEIPNVTSTRTANESAPVNLAPKAAAAPVTEAPKTEAPKAAEPEAQRDETKQKRKPRGGAALANVEKEIVVPPDQQSAPATSGAAAPEPAASAPPPPAEPPTDSGFALEPDEEKKPEPAAPPAPAKKRVTITAITPRRSTAGPCLQVDLTGEFTGRTFFQGEAAQFQGLVGAVGDAVITAKQNAATKVETSFIESFDLLA